jgi:NAD(P)H-dependent flavin oxidoreductase YrpB (nitropropane dioxygenase family)
VVTERLLAAGSSDTVRTRCITGKPARMLRNRYSEAWDGPDSPGALPMPLQYLATAEAQQRVRRAVASGNTAAAELAVTPVGQIVGRMKQLRPARQVFSEMVDEYLDTIERLARLMDSTAGQE